MDLGGPAGFSWVITPSLEVCRFSIFPGYYYPLSPSFYRVLPHLILDRSLLIVDDPLRIELDE